MKHCADTSIQNIFHVSKVKFAKTKAWINYWEKNQVHLVLKFHIIVTLFLEIG